VSKVDAQRAMREARFAEYRSKLAAERTAAGGAPAAPATRVAAAPAGEVGAPAVEKPRRVKSAKPRTAAEEASGAAADAASDAAEAAAALCGHRNMSGKSCSRPSGHSEKNHRYG
jgi:hypothetical protein